MFCQKCGKQLLENTQRCPYCGEDLQAAQTPAAAQQPMKMKWFKFVIWVQLFLAALSSLYTAFSLFTSSAYLGSADTIYSYYPGLKASDMIFGVIYIALIVFAIYTRQQLAHYKTNAPKLYLVFLVVVAVVSLLYAAVTSVMTGYNMFTLNVIVSLVSSVVMIVLNNIYFNKRKELFNN